MTQTLWLRLIGYLPRRAGGVGASVVACFAMLLVGGCGAGPVTSMPDVAAPTQAATIRPAGGTRGGESGAASSSVSVPVGATMTLLCRDFTGPDHASDARQQKAFAEQGAAEARLSTSFYIVHGVDRSVLYHGFYTTVEPTVDRREAARAAADRRMIDAMTIATPEGPRRIFGRALFVPLEQPDPVASPEYDLRNSDAFWTVAIAVYTDPARRKQAAVESVVEARKAGVEAYFLHDGNLSYVTVGSWPETAVRRGMSGQDAAAATDDPYNPRPLIISTGPVPTDLRDRVAARGGKTPLSFEVQLHIEDPSLMETMRAYDYDVDGFRDRDEPLLVNVPASLKRPVPREVAPPRDLDVSGTLVRPDGL